MVAFLTPPPFILRKALVETLVDRTTGTNIGNMTNGGGLAAAFDGNTSQAHTACARIDVGDGYVGKTFGAGKIFSRALVYGSNNLGLYENNPTVTIRIYGKNGAPSSATDGTIIGSLSFTDGASNTVREILSTDLSNTYTSIWFYMPASSTNAKLVAEIVLYEML